MLRPDFTDPHFEEEYERQHGKKPDGKLMRARDVAVNLREEVVVVPPPAPPGGKDE